MKCSRKYLRPARAVITLAQKSILTSSLILVHTCLVHNTTEKFEKASEVAEVYQNILCVSVGNICYLSIIVLLCKPWILILN